MSALLQDVRFALRGFLRAPGFTAVALVTLAIGIGANSAIFSVVDGVVLRPLPYPASEDLVLVQQFTADRRANAATFPDFEEWRRDNEVFSAMAGFHQDGAVLLRGDGPAQGLDAWAVTATFFDVLGVQPILGRSFAPGEDQDGNNRVAIFTHEGWKRRLGGDPDAVGRTIVLDDTPFTVIGVLPRGFRFIDGGDAELFLPVPRPMDHQLGKTREIRYISVLARLRPGVSMATAQAHMSTLAAAQAKAYPDTNAQRTAHVVGLQAFITADLRPALLILLGAVGFVLLIACANVANLLLARATVRHRELAIRIALGAGRGRVIRQLLTESVLLALAGGTLGVLLAIWGVELLRGGLPENVVGLAPLGIDARVLAFSAFISVLTGVAFGLVPALQASASSPQDALKDTRATAHRGRQRARTLLVGAEVALATLLLVGSALMLRSFAKVTGTDPGFRPEDVATVNLGLSDTRYPSPEAIHVFYERLLVELDRLPGARAAIFTPLPFDGFMSFGVEVEGDPQPPGEMRVASHHFVSPRFAETLGIPLRAGRALTAADDRPASPPVILVNEALVRAYFRGESPVGRRLWLEHLKKHAEIVGVVGDVREGTLEQEAPAAVYVPFAQAAIPGLQIAVRTRARTGLAEGLRASVAAVDASLAVGEVRMMTELLRETLAGRRLHTVLLSIFGAVALLLALIGIYGVMSYTVSQRAQEIGVRMALGARPGDVVRMVVGRAVLLAAAGVAAGLVASLGLTRFLAGLLYGVSPTDPQVYGTIAVLLVVVAALASFIPARRAAGVDPMIALRRE